MQLFHFAIWLFLGIGVSKSLIMRSRRVPAVNLKAQQPTSRPVAAHEGSTRKIQSIPKTVSTYSHDSGAKSKPSSVTGSKTSSVNVVEDTLRRTWKSGDTLVKTQPDARRRNNIRRNDPWWMRDEEKNNPRILPAYRPWWTNEHREVDSNWQLPELKEVARARGIKVDGSKDDLVRSLKDLENRFDLHDRNFRAPVFVPFADEGATAALCYPAAYENSAA